MKKLKYREASWMIRDPELRDAEERESARWIEWLEQYRGMSSTEPSEYLRVLGTVVRSLATLADTDKGIPLSMEFMELVEASNDVTELDKQYAYRMLELFACCLRVKEGNFQRSSELQERAYTGLKVHRIAGDERVLCKSLCMLSDDYGMSGRVSMAVEVLNSELEDPVLPWKKKRYPWLYASIRKKLRYWRRRQAHGWQ